MWLWSGLLCAVEACVRHRERKQSFSLIVSGLTGREPRERTEALMRPERIEVYLTLNIMDKTSKQAKRLLSFFIIILPSMQFD